MINERVVSDITMDIFYKPHTITLLLALCAFLIYKAFTMFECPREKFASEAVPIRV